MKINALLLLVALGATSSTMFGLTLYGDNATNGTPYVYAIDPTTMAITKTYTNLSSINGRGSVVVGTTLYYTTASSPSVYSYNLSTSTNNGVAFTVASSTALSTMAYDGTNFWIGDYSGTNHAYLYSPTGTLLKTISLGDCTGYCDGLEFFVDGSGNQRLISNEGDGETPGVYDVYDTNGNLITHNFINTGTNSGTGIAFDGTDFYVSNIFQGTISKYSSTGTFLQTQSLTGAPSGYGPLVEDLSFDYQTVLSNSPEPSTFALLGSGMVACYGLVRRRKARKG